MNATTGDDGIAGSPKDPVIGGSIAVEKDTKGPKDRISILARHASLEQTDALGAVP